MGCRIFGAGKGEVSFTTKGDVKAYVQFQQDVPKACSDSATGPPTRSKPSCRLRLHRAPRVAS